MTRTFKLSTVEQAVKVATTLTENWFRGHSRVHDELTPRVFRKEFRGLREPLERSMMEAFMRGAPALQGSLPGPEDYVEWLFLMQHHGGATRLLDWSESALVALYFVVDRDPSECGELWTMYPTELNRSSGFFGLPTREDPTVLFLSEEAAWGDSKRILGESDLSEIPTCPIAVRPPMNFARMVAQLSTFTIHPGPAEGKTIPGLLTSDKHLARYIVPPECKDRIRRGLAALGIMRRSLFPDLDSLSTDIIYEHHVVAYGPPSPPECDGEIFPEGE